MNNRNDQRQNGNGNLQNPAQETLPSTAGVDSSVGSPKSVGLLLSGGLDSAILLGHLLDQGMHVQPFYIQSGLHWQDQELESLRHYLAAVWQPELSALVILDLPLSDVYQNHWSITGRNVPAADSPDSAVFLPGRNALLVIKAALWCQLRGINTIALATLGSNPFSDATAEFFSHLEAVLAMAVAPLRIERPFADFDKRNVMQLGKELPLELTFSCIAPVYGKHCGRCNKCVERQAAFRTVGRDDLTDYAIPFPAEKSVV